MPASNQAGPPESARSAADDLLELYRAGTLVVEYPRVAGLLTDMSDEELERAGQLLSRLDPDKIIEEHRQVPAVTVAVTGHGTLAALVPALAVQLARHGLLSRTLMSDFDSYVLDLADVASELYAANPDIVACLLDPAMIFDEVPVPWTPDDVRQALQGKLGMLRTLADRFAAHADGTLVLNTIPLPRRFACQLVDLRSRAELGALWREANAELLRMAGERPSLIVLDLEPLIAEGVPAADTRMSVYAKAHLSAELLSCYARELGHLARHLRGMTKKALVLDLDNTVWGGVLGEDGASGIQVADSYLGEAFRAFQQTVKQFGSQGVLLAAASKNDVEPVREALTSHPRMTLREEDFVQISASWRPKDETIAELASSLNLGLDSFVFVDDSPFECGIVRRSLPTVRVLQVDDDPALHLERLLRDGWFTVRELTTGDRTRRVHYREDLVRKDFLDSFDSVADYLAELSLWVRLAVVRSSDVARVAQLTLRTNQFNLTTQRLQPADVAALLADPNAQPLAIHAGDRFGDNGLVGTLFTHRDGGVLHIDNMLLSCRVFARGVEQACLLSVLRHARETGASAVVGRYRQSAKNGKLRDFYERNGFRVVSSGTNGSTFRHDLKVIADPPSHIQLTERLGGTSSEHD